MAANFTSTGSDTYPAGISIQTIFSFDSGTHRTTTSSTLADTGGLSCAITTKQLNSKIAIHLTTGMAGYTNSLAIDVKRVITSGTTVNNLAVDGGVAGGSYGITQDEFANNAWHSVSFHYQDAPSQAAGTTITYTPRIKNGNNSTAVYFLHSGALAIMSVQEIAV